MIRKQDMIWILPFGLIGVLISLVPLVGYLVNASRHDQWVFLVLLAGWIASIGFAVASSVMIFVTPGKSLPIRLIMILLTLLFAGLIALGFGGLADGFYELIAG